MSYPKKITATRDELISMHESGLSFAKIGAIFGVCTKAVRRITGKLGTPLNYYAPQPIKDRLLSKIKVSDNGCWEWTASVGKPGYGHIWYNGKHVDAHRASWITFRGSVPDGLWVLHRCDNRLCINPDHLFLGTPSDNMIDLFTKFTWVYSSDRKRRWCEPKKVDELSKSC